MKRILPTIVIAQFFCTSLWFAGNAVIGDIALKFQLDAQYLAYLTSTVQFGFITGTLVFSLLSIADRFSPSKVFFTCAILAGMVNLVIGYNIDVSTLILCRFLTGFFLAGIYPVGMKIAADHYDQKLGRSLGWLVGALVMGTAFPFLLKSIGIFPWGDVILVISILSFLGGLIIWFFVPDGPFRKPGQKLNLGAFLTCFKHKKFSAVALGYFGHNWELYAFWVFLPVILTHYKNEHPNVQYNIPLLCFLIIGAGGIACVLSGIIAQHFGAKKIAILLLLISCTCCLISPILLESSPVVLVSFLFIWGMAVVADSPLFSTLIAQNAIPALKGTALTIVISIGFAVTIVSIQLISALRTSENANFIYMLLALGPIVGLISLFRENSESMVHVNNPLI